MLPAVFINFINLFVLVFNALLLARVVWSWVDAQPKSGLGALLFELTDPVLVPIRRVLPAYMGMDFSPLVAFLLLQLLATLVNGTG